MRCGAASSGRRWHSSGGASSQPVSLKKQGRISGCATAGAWALREPPPPMPPPTSSSPGPSRPPSWGTSWTSCFRRGPPCRRSPRSSTERRMPPSWILSASGAPSWPETTATRVANTAGAGGEYRGTGFGVSADVWRIAGDDVLVVSDTLEGADVPSDEALAALVASINGRLDRALRIAAPPEGALPVVFTPAGLSALMLPVTQALSGKAVLQGISPLGAKVGEQVFDARFSLADDPLRVGRTPSRPLDDECVPSRTMCLVERGVVQRFIYDLETGARAKTESTGHGTRGIFGKPVPAYTNLVLGVGDQVSGRKTSELGGGLLRGVRDGLLVDELIGVGQGNVTGGAFSHPVALAYRIERGEITGRVKDAAVAGNAYELWKRVGGFGNDARWTESRWAPSVLFEGVSVARR